MIISTNLPSKEERMAALEVVPWHESVRQLSTEIAAAFNNRGIDLIDTSIGPNHCRAALVALLDGTRALLQATIELAESVVRARVFSRLPPVGPFGIDEELSPEDQAQLTLRYTVLAIEDAAVRVASAGDHLANAHVRMAWEANAASSQEVRRCGFDPEKAEPERWISVTKLHEGLNVAERNPLGIIRDFTLNEAFFAYANSAAVRGVRSFRDQVVHRDRPTYREVPSLGRTTLWTQEKISFKVPSQAEPDESAPTIQDRRSEVGEGLVETLQYAHALWNYTKLWLTTVDVWLTPLPGRQVQIEAGYQVGTHSPRFPRNKRDPGPFLRPG